MQNNKGCEHRTAGKKRPLLHVICNQNSLLRTVFLREAIESYYENCEIFPVRTEPTAVKAIYKFSGGEVQYHSNVS
jgi:hypothetical protein